MFIIYENTYAVYEIKDQILQIRLKKEVYITYEVAVLFVADRIKVQGYQPYLVLFILDGLQGIEAHAREYFAHQGNIFLKATALVAGQPSLYRLAQYFVLLNVPNTHIQVFKTRTAAVLYLKEML